MSLTLPIPYKLLAELDRLNHDVESAIKTRTKWLDDHMEEVSKVKPGDALYDVNSGELVGIVRKLYRYWAEQNPLFDTHLSVECEYNPTGSPPNVFDNTSRQEGRMFGTKEEIIKEKHVWEMPGRYEEIFK